MEYRAVGKRCAVILDSLHIPVTPDEALSMLQQKGFAVATVDIVALARSYVGVSEYQLDAQPSQAPAIVNCSNFTKWVFAQRGCWLPQYAIEQRKRGQIVERHELHAGDLVFTGGRYGFHHNNPEDKVGHVGIMTDDATVIHSKRKAGGVIEETLEAFLGKKQFRGARRYFPSNQTVHTLVVPQHIEIETTRDLEHLIKREHSLRQCSGP